jgi:hypothetical protein
VKTVLVVIYPNITVNMEQEGGGDAVGEEGGGDTIKGNPDEIRAEGAEDVGVAGVIVGVAVNPAENHDDHQDDLTSLTTPRSPDRSLLPPSL